jgi:hypothetical protein
VRGVVAYLDDCTEKRFIARELVLLFVRLLLFNATFEVLVPRHLYRRSIISAFTEEGPVLFTHSVNSRTQVHECVHGVDLRPRQSRMLVQPSTVLVGDAFSVQDVQCDDADLVRVTVADMVR